MTSKSLETLEAGGLSAEGADVFPPVPGPVGGSGCLGIVRCHAMTNGDASVN